MRIKPASLLLGLCLVATAAMDRPAHAEAITGYSSFHVVRWSVNQNQSAENCLTEFYGAVVNNCTATIKLDFDLPANAGGHNVVVQNLWVGTAAQSTFQCTLFAYDGTGAYAVAQQTLGFNGPAQKISFNIDDGNNDSLQLFCDVPVGGGVANINWN